MLTGCAPTPPPEAPQLAANCEQVPEDRFVEAGGLRLRYVERGEGEPSVVLLHGNGAMVEDFAISGVLAASASQHHRTVAFDRPGYGASERPRDRNWTPAAQATLLAEAFARLGIRRPIVVGHSWGTLVALALALDHPDAVSGLVLIAGYYYPTGRADLALSQPFAAPVLGDVLRYTVLPVTGPLAAPGLIRQMFAPLPVPACFSAEFPLEKTLRPRPERASAEETAVMEPAVAALAPRYHELRVPVAILAGSGDRLVDPIRQSVRLHQQLPGSLLIVVPGQGHMVHYGAPDLIAGAVDAVAARRNQ
jgi:pimeloyl-ACP methyl ester carboxylesterase